ncbi:hypothetical protein DSO57_1019107 [Entomophthora muscae]|uniref:Uncharacterized protein n=1 Tax=Entomophthora muscae TaxID=34485 RepID=A0ACC2UE52_9FUNG|nr:hypothetical protein DSO57_1019107 [Entomophthora muscae]
MKGIYFLLWFLSSLFITVKGLENPTPTIDWQNPSPNNAHQKESLSNGWFKYPSGHWGRKFHYGRHSTPPPAKPLLVQPHASFYLLMYMAGYYLLGHFSSLMGRFAYIGHLGHLAMVTVPIGSAITWFNLGALAHQIGGLFPLKWVPDRFSAVWFQPEFHFGDGPESWHVQMFGQHPNLQHKGLDELVRPCLK